MARFKCSYKEKNGTVGKRIVEASNIKQAAISLKQTGVIPLEILPIKELVSENEFENKKIKHGKVTKDDLLLLTKELHSLLKAGVALSRALSSLEISSSKLALSNVLADIKSKIDAGYELNVALQEHRNVFPPFYIQMIKTGEETGRLEEIFLKLYNYIEFDIFIKRQVKSALRYPLFLFSAMFAALLIVNIFIIPVFANLFASIKVELPIMTTILMVISNFINKFWWMFSVVGVGGFFAFKNFISTDEGEIKWDRFKLHIPIAGQIILKATLSRFAHGFYVAYNSGIPAIQALQLSARIVDNKYIEKKINEMAEEIRKGDSLYRTAKNSKVFTSVVLEMINIGEETGELDSLLEEVSDFYRKEVEYDLKNLSSMIEPIMIIFLGIGVLILALGIFMPMWKLSSALLK